MNVKKNIRRGILFAVILTVIIVGVAFFLFAHPFSKAALQSQTEKLFCKKPSRALDYPPPPEKRILSFPKNEAVGLLYTTTGITNYGYDMPINELHGPAQGDISLPQGTSACLEIKEGFSSVLGTLPPYGVQAIDFSAPVEIPFELNIQNQKKRIASLTDENLEPVRKIKGLYQLILHNTTITDQSLASISEVKDLRLINLWNTKITDKGLVYLAQLPFLDTIYLGATDISDEGLKHLCGLKRLRCLWLTGSNRSNGNNTATAYSVNHKITDAGMAYVNTLTSLENLNIANTGITDKSIDALSQLNSLSYLDISGTKISEEGLKTLQVALPKCKIIKDAGLMER